MDFARKDNVEHFQLRLTETIAWCFSQDWSFQPKPRRKPAWDPPKDYHQIMDVIAWVAAQNPIIIAGTGLRTNQLCPPDIEDNARAIFDARYPKEKTWELLAIDRVETQRQWQQNVEQLAAKRAMLLQAQNLPIHQVLLPHAKGRLLAYFPGQTLSDGAAEAATDGFFDADNVPAWDTWLVYVAEDDLLLSWVPDSLVEMVEDGIDVNPEECIRWAADLDTAYVLQLKQAGFLC